jgi:protocatechuate 3,4-dioxygenase beta subunit
VKTNMINRSSVYRSLATMMVLAVVSGLLVNVSFLIFSKASGQAFSGTVHGAGGVPVVGAMVFASGSNGSGYAVTNSQGQYSITDGLKTGSYSVTSMANGYLYNETDNVQVTVGLATTGIDIYLHLSGVISGRVTETGTGTPLSTVMLIASPSNGSGSFVGQAVTDANGDYTIAMNLGSGTYNVLAFYPEGHVTKIASGINVIAGQEVKNTNLQLDRSGIVWGRITVSPGGQALPDATVYANSDNSIYFGSAHTNATGYYTITSGLGTDTYTVSVYYPPMSFNDTTGVSVTAGGQTRVDLSLEVTPPSPSGIITGKVTDTNNQPIKHAHISADGDTTYSSGSATADDQGNYVISSGLETDTYTVTASAAGYTSVDIQDVSVTVNEVTSDVDFQLPKIPPAQSGTISGSVQGDENPIPEFTSPSVIVIVLTTTAVLLVRRLKAKTKRANLP